MTGHGFHYSPCRGSGGGGAAVAVAVLVAVLVVARAAVHAVAVALPYILGAVAVTGVLGGAVAAALVSLSRDRRRIYTAVAGGDNDSDTPGVTYQRHEPVAAPTRRAELPPAESHEQHIPMFLLSPQDVAAIIAARKENQP